MSKAFIQVDGASKGNPGPAGIGVAILDESGKVLKEISEYIGEKTNNFAEYTALIRALGEAHAMGFTSLDIQTDSELMERQINGQYRVKNDGIIPLFETALQLMCPFKKVVVKHVLRDKNKLADKLASAAAMSKAAPAQPAPPVQPSLMLEEAPKPAKAPKKPEVKSAIQRIGVRTSARNQFVDITHDVQDAVKSSGVTDGVCSVYVPHTTAGVTINENADPNVTRDMIDILASLVPQSPEYKHAEGNSDAHVKASMMGSSVTVFVEGGKLVLGTWQAIYFAEFDGPRSREVYVRVG